VSKTFRHDFGIYTLLEEQGSVCVTQIMKPYFWHICSLYYSMKDMYRSSGFFPHLFSRSATFLFVLL